MNKWHRRRCLANERGEGFMLLSFRNEKSILALIVWICSFWFGYCYSACAQVVAPTVPSDPGSVNTLPVLSGAQTSTATPFAISSGTNPTPGNVQIDGGPALFGVPAHFAVDQSSGSAIYVVPLDLPPGVAGLLPHLSLIYNSAAGNGYLGVGWSLSGLPEIVRCPQTIATNGMAGGVNDDANDRFCLDGQQLIAAPAQVGGSVGVDGANGTHYAKEIDDFSQVTSYGSTSGSFNTPSYFEVKTKTGLVLEFGRTGNSQQLSSSGSVVEAWALDQITDPRSNYVTITYSNAPLSGDSSVGTLYPTQVHYTGNSADNVAATNVINITWQSRLDDTKKYSAGTPHMMQDRMASILTYAGSKLISEYRFGYQYGTTTGRSDLITITKLDGSTPQNALPSLTFCYSDTASSSCPSADTPSIDVQPDLVESINNGFGATTFLHYIPAASPTVDSINNGYPSETYPLSQNIRQATIVQSVQQVVPGIGLNTNGTIFSKNVSYTTNYYYSSGEVNLSGRGYLGFQAGDAIDVQTGLVYSNIFYHNFPFIGRVGYHIVSGYGTTAQYDNVLDSYGSIQSAQGTIFPYLASSTETNHYEMRPGSSFNAPYVFGSELPTTTKYYQYDTSGPNNSSWGELAAQQTVTSDGYKETHNYTYAAPDLTDWIIGEVTQDADTAQGIGQATPQTRVTQYTYWGTAPGKGLLATVEVAPGEGSNLDEKTTYQYDQFGNTITKIINGADVDGAVVTQAAYDANGQFPVSITNAMGQQETLAFDPAYGKIKTITDFNHQTSTYYYDGFGRQIQVTHPDGTYTGTYYGLADGTSPMGLQIVTDRPGGASIAPTVTKFFDSVGRPTYIDTQSFTANGSATSSRIADVFDEDGNLFQTTLPFYPNQAPQIITKTYDEPGHVLSVTHPDGSVDQFTYLGTTLICPGSTNKCADEEIVSTNGLGQISTIFKDGRGNIAWVGDTFPHFTAFIHDGFDQLTEVIDPAGNVTSYAFDIRGRNTSGVDPDKGSWTANYNSLNELVTTTDAAGNSASMTYDQLGRMTGRVETGTNGATSLTSSWVYDSSANGVGLLASESSSGTASPSGNSNVGFSQSYSYTQYGKLAETTTSVATPWTSGTIQTYHQFYTYDASDRPSSTSNDWGDGYTATYNAAGYRTGETYNATAASLWTETAADASNNLTGEIYGNNAVLQSIAYYPTTEREYGTLAIDGSGNTLESFNYGYDVLGNVTSKSSNATTSLGTGFTEYYTYDGLNRLCSVNPSSASLAATASSSQACPTQPSSLTSVGVGVTYDSLGDITAKLGNGGVGTYTYPAAGSPRPHAVQSISNNAANINGGLNASFSYDADGNMLSGSFGQASYTAFDMPSEMCYPNCTSPLYTVTYGYGPDHQKVTETQAGNGAVSALHLDKMDILYPPGSSAGEVVTYVPDNNGNTIAEIDRTNITTIGAQASDQIALKYILTDWQNSASVITNNTGAVLQAYSYDAWGKIRNLNGAPDANDTIAWPRKGYTNQRENNGLHLIDLNARMYDPQIGVMLSVDPAVANWLDPQSWNAYAYARENPLAYTDPTGETSSHNDVASGEESRTTCDQNGCVNYNSQAQVTGFSFSVTATPSPASASSQYTQGVAGLPEVGLGAMTGVSAGVIEAGAAGLGVVAADALPVAAAVGAVAEFASGLGDAAGTAVAMEEGATAATVGNSVAVEEIATPYGVATQELSPAALKAQSAVRNGATLYRGGVLGQSAGPEAQFWSPENPLSPGYAERYGIPAENMNFDFVETGTLNPGTNFITRSAPGIGSNGGGAIEVVTPSGGVTLNLFSMP